MTQAVYDGDGDPKAISRWSWRVNRPGYTLLVVAPSTTLGCLEDSASTTGRRPPLRLDQIRADWSAWKALLVRAGVRDARLHDARHTAATLLLTQGVSARVAMQILGHSQISLTLGTYSHVMPELAEDAAARVGDALWGPLATTLAPSAPVRGPQ